MNYKNMTEEEITYQLEWSDENEFGTNYAKFLREENKQLKEKIKWYEKENKHNQEIIVKDTSILTELEEFIVNDEKINNELLVSKITSESGKERLGIENVIYDDILDKIQELKEKYK